MLLLREDIPYTCNKAKQPTKLLDMLTRANATLLAYANKKIEDLDNRSKMLSKTISDLSEPVPNLV